MQFPGVDDIANQIDEFESFVSNYVDSVDAILHSKDESGSKDIQQSIQKAVEQFKSLGNSEYQQKKYSSALSFYNSAIDTVRNSNDDDLEVCLTSLGASNQGLIIETVATALQNKGLCLLKLEMLQKAADAFEEALKWKPELQKPAFHLPLVYLQLMQYEKALTACEYAAGAVPEKAKELWFIREEAAIALRLKTSDSKLRQKLANDTPVVAKLCSDFERSCSMLECPAYKVLQKLLRNHPDGKDAVRLVGMFEILEKYLRNVCGFKPADSEAKKDDITAVERILVLVCESIDNVANARIVLPTIALLCTASESSAGASKTLMKIAAKLASLCQSHQDFQAALLASNVASRYGYNSTARFCFAKCLHSSYQKLDVLLTLARLASIDDSNVLLAAHSLYPCRQLTDLLAVTIRDLPLDADNALFVAQTAELLQSLKGNRDFELWLAEIAELAVEVWNYSARFAVSGELEKSTGELLLNIVTAFPRATVRISKPLVKQLASKISCEFLDQAAIDTARPYILLLALFRNRIAGSFGELGVHCSAEGAARMCALGLEILNDDAALNNPTQLRLLNALFVVQLSVLEPTAEFLRSASYAQAVLNIVCVAQKAFLKAASALRKENETLAANIAHLLGECARRQFTHDKFAKSRQFLTSATAVLRSTANETLKKNLCILFGQIGRHVALEEFMQKERIFELLHHNTTKYQLL